MYIQGMAQQTQVFLLCVGFGFLLGAVYDILKLTEKLLFPKSRNGLFRDIVFSIICTVSSFMFLLCIDGGKLRLYPYGGMAAGFAIWRFTLGIPVRYVLDRTADIISRFFAPLFTAVNNIFKKSLKIVEKIKNKRSKPLEKSENNSV